jgi:DNA polymerase-3 subunit delta'
MATATATAPIDADRQCTLDRMIGHAEARRFLAEAVERGRAPRALLLLGPAGVGKRTMAWSLARQIVASPADPQTHPGAAKVARGTHPDVWSLPTKESLSGQVLVKEIRDMEDRLATAPIEAEKKVVIIAPAERMTEEAANALLKTLEEPPRHAVLILTSVDPARLPTTIRSRCTPVALDAVARDELIAWLRVRSDQGRERIELAARLAEGRPGFALALLSGGALETRRELLGELALLKQHGFAAIFRVADRWATIGDDVASNLEMLLLLLRDLLVARMGAATPLNVDLEDELQALADGLSPEGLLEAAARVESSAAEIGHFYTPQAKAHFLEVLATRIGRAIRTR